MQKNRFSDIIQIFKYKFLWRKYQTNTLLIITIRRIIIICVNRDLDLFDESKFEIFFTDANETKLPERHELLNDDLQWKLIRPFPQSKKKKKKGRKRNPIADRPWTNRVSIDQIVIAIEMLPGVEGEGYPVSNK